MLHPFFVMDDTALLALGGNRMASRLVINRESQSTLVPLLALAEAGKRRPGLTVHVGQLAAVEFSSLTYAALVEVEDTQARYRLPPGAAHALVVAQGILVDPVWIASSEPDRYAVTGVDVVDLNV
ncbi:hypothetical protein [Streptomyces sp. NPDC002851]